MSAPVFSTTAPEGHRAAAAYTWIARHLVAEHAPENVKSEFAAWDGSYPILISFVRKAYIVVLEHPLSTQNYKNRLDNPSFFVHVKDVHYNATAEALKACVKLPEPKYFHGFFKYGKVGNSTVATFHFDVAPDLYLACKDNGSDFRQLCLDIVDNDKPFHSINGPTSGDALCYFNEAVQALRFGFEVETEHRMQSYHTIRCFYSDPVCVDFTYIGRSREFLPGHLLYNRGVVSVSVNYTKKALKEAERADKPAKKAKTA